MSMGIIASLQKNKTTLSLLFLGLIFFLLRLPSVIEPDWYGDEGVYQVIGMALDHGRQLYTQIWDNKPPLLYLTYALVGGNLFSIRFLSLVFGIAALISVFLLARKLYSSLNATLIASSIFTILFATPLIEGNIANAENFMLFPITLAGLIVYQITINKTNKRFAINHKLLLAGLLLGIAFIFKIVAVFDFAAFLVFLFFDKTREIQFRSIKSIFQIRLAFLLAIKEYIVGFFLPLAVTVIYFYFTNAFSTFLHASFLSNVSYVGYGNAFIIPQGLLIFKLILLAIFLLTIFVIRKQLSQPLLFVFIWVGFSIFSALFSQRPYTHYLLVTLPAFSLLAGLLFSVTAIRSRIVVAVVLLLKISLLLYIFHPYSLKKTVAYYQNIVMFISGNESVSDYQAFFDRKTPRDYQIASFIKANTRPQDQVFIWGNNPQIYALSHKLPPGRYTVAYHILQYPNGVAETEKALRTVKPKYIIILPESPDMPISPFTYMYDTTFSVAGTTIYEKAK